MNKVSPQQMYDAAKQFLIAEKDLRENGYIYFENEESKRAQFQTNQKFNQYAFMSDNDDTRKCTRCGKLFNRKVNDQCQYHPFKSVLYDDGHFYFSCCQQKKGDSKGCTVNQFHVHQQPPQSALDRFVRAPQPVSLTDYRSNKIFGLDVEMVHTENGLEAARISLVDFENRKIIDEFIMPEGRILDLNTKFSGITMSHLKNAKGLSEIHKMMFQFVNRSTILVGHCLSNDLKVLRLVHSNIIDTGILMPMENGNISSLKDLAKRWLGIEIQTNENGHDSVEDARACIQIVEKIIKL